MSIFDADDLDRQRWTEIQQVLDRVIEQLPKEDRVYFDRTWVRGERIRGYLIMIPNLRFQAFRYYETDIDTPEQFERRLFKDMIQAVELKKDPDSWWRH